MKRIILRLTLVLLVLVAGCDKPSVNIVEDTLKIAALPGTKVHMEGLKTCWDHEDKLTVFYRNAIPEMWTFKGQTGDVSGQISHESITRRQTRDDIIVLYPYDADAYMEGNAVHTEIPSTQVYRKDSYGTAVLASRTDFDILTMRYCTAVVELKFTGFAEISHILLSGANGEKVSGQSVIEFDRFMPQLTCVGQSSVRLECNTSIEDSETVSFYFSMAPGTFRNGIEFLVHFNNGDTQKISVAGNVSIAPGHIYTVCADSAMLEHDQISMHLVFSDGTSQHHPFTQQIAFKDRGTRMEYFYLLDGVQYPFYLYCQLNDSYQFRNTAKGGLYIGGTEGDYIEFPAVSGYRLTRIAVSANKDSYFHVVPTDNTSITVEGGSCTAMLDGAFRILDLSKTETGKSYRMMLDNDAVFRYITLYYRR